MNKSNAQIVNAVIMAGDSSDGAVDTAVKNKSFLPINGKPMVLYVAEALRQSKIINKISAVGPENDLNEILNGKVDYIMDGDGSMFDNAITGMQPLNTDGYILFVTSDIPMITAEAIDDFISQGLESQCDACYPIIKKEIVNNAFPGAHRTYFRLRNGVFTGGNLILVRRSKILELKNFAVQILSLRKSPVKVGRILGITFVIRFACGILSLKQIEKRVRKMLAIEGRGIISNYASVGNDVDKPEDVEIIVKAMNVL